MNDADTLSDRLTRDELGEVTPVCSDVGERADSPPIAGIPPPVIDRRVGEPVLEIAAVDHAPVDQGGRPGRGCAAREPSGRSGTRAARRRQRRPPGRDRAARGPRRDRSRGASRRLRASPRRAPRSRTGGAASSECRCGRRRQPRRRRQPPRGSCRWVNPEPLRGRMARRRRRCPDSPQLGSGKPDRPLVDRTDEADADHGGAQSFHQPHPSRLPLPCHMWGA